MKKSVFPFVFLLGSLFFCNSARAAEGVGFYLEPLVGFSRVTVKTLEIEKSFITSKDDDPDDGVEDDWSAVDPNEVQGSVGRKAYFAGAGFSLGAAAGIKLFSLSLGGVYAWDSVTMDGYSKRYRYRPTGRKFLDSGTIDLHRVMAQVKYGLPIGRIEVNFQTRIGVLYLDEGPLLMGRAIDSGSGFSGDVGIGLAFSVTSWLSVGVNGYFGFFSFTGDYEGAYGTIGGMNGSFVVHI